MLPCLQCSLYIKCVALLPRYNFVIITSISIFWKQNKQILSPFSTLVILKIPFCYTLGRSRNRSRISLFARSRIKMMQHVCKYNLYSRTVLCIDILLSYNWPDLIQVLSDYFLLIFLITGQKPNFWSRHIEILVNKSGIYFNNIRIILHKKILQTASNKSHVYRKFYSTELRHTSLELTAISPRWPKFRLQAHAKPRCWYCVGAVALGSVGLITVIWILLRYNQRSG
jgi:hypothetical protein